MMEIYKKKEKQKFSQFIQKYERANQGQANISDPRSELKFQKISQVSPSHEKNVGKMKKKALINQLTYRSE